MKGLLVIFIFAISGNGWSKVAFESWDSDKTVSKLSQMKKRFNKRVVNNPLLRMKVKTLARVITLTEGKCDRKARFNVVRCYYNMKDYTRRDDGYRMDDFRDPRVYARYYRYIQGQIKRSPDWGRREARDYGYQERYIP